MSEPSEIEDHAAASGPPGGAARRRRVGRTHNRQPAAAASLAWPQPYGIPLVTSITLRRELTESVVPMAAPSALSPGDRISYLFSFGLQQTIRSREKATKDTNAAAELVDDAGFSAIAWYEGTIFANDVETVHVSFDDAQIMELKARDCLS